ncbi:MAG: undecaprenyldiphospho-muramoylpentapeptide beta-N-acetylglucosaminyltransferase [candidate division NC10 bacterium]|nr:undecaprenyldiphospho-muramoylpentapeptide beta-N-acetylglucosaminyltransferase [candidate division NC10 bacterium]
MRVLIAAGGTGGHIFPALAIARHLRREGGRVHVEFVGTGDRMEAEWLEGEGFPLHPLKIQGLKGKKVVQLLSSLVLLPQAFLRSWGILSRVRPDVTVGLGGYASGPLLLLSALRGIPTLIHEQNSLPGLTNRILAPFVKQIAYSFPGSERYFRGRRAKLTFTGNPVRREILVGDRKEAALRFGLDPQRFTLLCFGGSRGASRINSALLEALPLLLPIRDQIQFLHASGERDFEAVLRGFATYPFRARVYPFIHEMASAYALADLVISRAGATTLAELAALGKPSILIPYPYAANDHQKYNAQVLASSGGARILLDHEVNGPVLARAVQEVLEDQAGREAMGQRVKSLAKMDADEKIAHLILSLAKDPDRTVPRNACPVGGIAGQSEKLPS